MDTIKSVENGRRAMSLDTYLNIVHEKLSWNSNLAQAWISTGKYSSDYWRLASAGAFVYTQESISIDKTLIKQLYWMVDY